MSDLDLARWQFGITTVYHFLFVPLTISLGFIVAGFETAWVRTKNEKWLKLTHFFGDIFLINFALGIVTGLVQEFQFGMNWSEFSRFVGDIFGVPLAIETLLAFFLESVFLGVWIFGWDRISPRLHAATIWLVAIGSTLSAYWILVANSFMQEPSGFVVNPVTHRAELTDIVPILFNKSLALAFLHVIAACFVTGGALLLGVGVWRVVRRPGNDADVFRSAVKVGSVILLVSAVSVVVIGDQLGKNLDRVQPMKLAAAEGLYDTEQPAGLSLVTLWGPDGKEIFSIKIPNLLSYLATGDFNGKVEGVNELQAQYQAAYPQFGSVDYSPIIPVTFWSFRLMVGLGFLSLLAAVWFLWRMRAGRVPRRIELYAAALLPFLPLLANSLGWIFREMGRQPWLVQGYFLTSSGVSPGTGGMIFVTLIGFTLLYGILAVVEAGLVFKVIRTPEISTHPIGLGLGQDSDAESDAFGY